MEISDLASLRPELERFIARFDGCIKTRPSRAHLRRYVAGQLSDLPRKSAEPIALATGVPPRTLQEFLSLHLWDDRAMRDRVLELVEGRHGDEDAIGLIDETSVAKKGPKTPGVQRQHCGATGKTDNCIVTVHLGYATDDFSALLDGDLYLPQSWSEDRARCREAGIPEEVSYRPKWQIALDLLEHASRRGLSMRWVCADEEYGRPYPFRQGVAHLGLRYVLEVPRTTRGWGLRQLRTEPTRRAEQWAKGRGRRWTTWRIKDTDKGPSVWRVRAVRWCPAEERQPGEEQWLLVARNTLEDEVKYFLSNAPASTPVGALLRVAFSRWHIERLFQEAKQQAGFADFEGRRYLGLRRHLVLTNLSLLYLAEQRGRLREKKGSTSAWGRSVSPSSASSMRR
jgi:SRSO17 transposase